MVLSITSVEMRPMPVVWEVTRRVSSVSCNEHVVRVVHRFGPQKRADWQLARFERLTEGHVCLTVNSPRTSVVAVLSVPWQIPPPITTISFA